MMISFLGEVVARGYLFLEKVERQRRVFKQPNELNMDWKSMKRGETRMTVSVLLVSEHAHLFLFHCL